MEMELLERVRLVIPLVLSLSVHEWAHAYSAYRLGDDTAARQGRLTLNPLAHIDWIGTVLLPLMGIPFGWAKPVPVNPTRFTRKVHMQTGMMLTAAAGPISNLVLAVLSLLAYVLLPRLGVQNEALIDLFELSFGMNIGLAVFNLLPIFPLDGSRVADWMMPRGFRPQWEQFTRIGPYVLMALIVVPPLRAVVLTWPMQKVASLTAQLVYFVTGI